MTKQVSVGGVTVGGGAPVRVQSMTTTPTSDVEATLAQFARLYAAGCEFVRVAVRGEADARAIRALKDRSPMPVVADIHFSDRLALLAVESGADKIRINPGNIGGEAAVRRVADCVRAHGIPAAPPARWSKAPSPTSPASKNTALTTSSSPSRRPPCPSPSRRTAPSPRARTIRSTSA